MCESQRWFVLTVSSVMLKERSCHCCALAFLTAGYKPSLPPFLTASCNFPALYLGKRESRTRSSGQPCRTLSARPAKAISYVKATSSSFVTHFVLGQEKPGAHRNILFCYQCFPVMRSNGTEAWGIASPAIPRYFQPGPLMTGWDVVEQDWGEGGEQPDLLGESTFPSAFHPL